MKKSSTSLSTPLTEKTEKVRKRNRAKPSKEWCCDFETTSKAQYLLEGRTRVYLYKMVDLMSGKEEYYGVNLMQFFSQIINKPKKYSKIYFHNLSFDGTFIIDFLLNCGWKWYREIEQCKDYFGFSSIIDLFGSIYQIRLKIGENIILVNCSYKLTGLSIKDLGKLVGLDKLNETHDYTEIKNYKSVEELSEEEKMYITNDVEIMRRGILKCYEMGICGLTRSSACYNLWKKKCWFKYTSCKEIDDDEKILHLINASYRGGIVIMNKRFAGKVLGESRNYDVNSLYPSVMYHKMPSGKGLHVKDESMLPRNYDIRLYEIYIDHAKIISPYIPFIPTQKNTIYKDSYEYNEEIDQMAIYLWGDEFDLFKLYYEGVYKVVSIVGYQSEEKVFDDYLDFFKNIKENAPNPSPERTFAKGCMNGLYGKFAQVSSRVSKQPYLDERGELAFDKYVSESDSQYDRKKASFITSLARCVLIKGINKDPERFIYCDTDSIYVVGDYPYDIPCDQKKLGFWKYEYSYDNFKGLKAKCYIATIKGTGEIHSAVAGLPKEQQQKLTFESFKDGLTIIDAKHQLKRVKGGIIIDSVPFTIKVKKDIVITTEV